MKIDEYWVEGNRAFVNIVIQEGIVRLEFQIDEEEKKLHILGYVKTEKGKISETKTLTNSEYETARNLAREALLSDPQFSDYT